MRNGIPLHSGYIEDLDVLNTIHKSENIVQYSAFTSTSKSVYDETMDIQLVITSKHGKDISK